MKALSRNLLLAAILAPATMAFASCGSEGSTTGFTPPAYTGGSSGSPGDAQPDTTAQPETGPEAAPEAAPDVAEDVPVTPEAGPEPQPESGPGDGGKDAQGPSWPDCTSKPDDATSMTIGAIWNLNPSSDTYVWVSGVFISAISKGGCVANSTCQIYLQDAETYNSWSASAHHGLKLLVYNNASSGFVGLKVGDKVDVAGQAGRPQNELLIRVGKMNLPGCAKATGLGAPQPVTGVSLSDLTVDAYENSHGPVLLQVSSVTGKPGNAGEIFGIWNTGAFNDAGPEGMVSVSPYFLPNGQFTGLDYDGGTQVKFTSVTGVFGMFMPSTDAGTAPKYMVLYPRTMSEVVIAP